MLSQPSLDCLVQRNRLQYLARLVANKPRAVLAILQATPHKQQLPWTVQLARDLQQLYEGVCDVKVLLPPLTGNGSAWVEFILSQPDKRHNLVGQLFYSTSCLDKVANLMHDSRQLTFECELCAAPQPAFPTSKALALGTA